MQFEIKWHSKRLVFDSDLRGLKVNGVEYVSGRDGVLIYDKTRDLQADEVELQMSTNTSTLIPALRILRIPYHSYFDERPSAGFGNFYTKSVIGLFRCRTKSCRKDFCLLWKSGLAA